MSEDIGRQVVELTKTNPAKISLQLDESTDVSHHAPLAVLAWYVHKN
jgi:hypothetical protein